jgi:hypothetical protein
LIIGVSVPIGYQCLHSQGEIPIDLYTHITIEISLAVIWILFTMIYWFIFRLFVSPSMDEVEGLPAVPHRPVRKTRPMRFQHIKHTGDTSYKVNEEGNEETIELAKQYSKEPGQLAIIQ